MTALLTNPLSEKRLEWCRMHLRLGDNYVFRDAERAVKLSREKQQPEQVGKSP